MSRYEQVDEYLYASGRQLTPEGLSVLEKYERLVARHYCRPGCGDCLDACPYGVPVNDVFRYAMYGRNYGREKDAMLKYARIDPAHRADHCAGCAAPCEARCEFGLPIRQELLRAHERLRWA
jgi:predicted aldo/keto reductase-like oxidoreductase